MRIILLITGLMLLCPPAGAGLKTAVVYNRGSEVGPRGEMPCAMRVKAALRELGYTVLPEKERGEASLRVGISADCTLRTIKNNCKARLQVFWRGQRSFSLESERTYADSVEWALDEACSDVTKKLGDRLGAPSAGSGGESTGRPAGRLNREVSVRFKGPVKPMPLIKLSGYFEDMGYRAKLLKSDANQVRFRVAFEVPLSQFQSKLRMFLDAHYRIVSIGGNSNLNFVIEAL